MSTGICVGGKGFLKQGFRISGDICFSDGLFEVGTIFVNVIILERLKYSMFYSQLIILGQQKQCVFSQ